MDATMLHAEHEQARTSDKLDSLVRDLDRHTAVLRLLAERINHWVARQAAESSED